MSLMWGECSELLLLTPFVDKSKLNALISVSVTVFVQDDKKKNLFEI